jgi:hypothetical protein
MSTQQLLDRGGMRLRWSDGHSHAVEFAAGARAEFADALDGALVEFRRVYGEARVELHVQAGIDRWTDPVLTFAQSDWVKMPAMSNARVNGIDVSDREWVIQGGYVKTINCAGRVPLDPDGTPPHANGLMVLVVGPGAWHADELYMGCIKAIQAMGHLTGLAADVYDAVIDRCET